MELTINADDFGISAPVNEAIDICIKNDFVQRTTLIVNMPYTEEAVALAKQHKYMGKVGLHINLVEGMPLTNRIRTTSFCNETGEFNHLFFKKVYHRIFLMKKEREAVKEEIEAQIKKFVGYGFKTNHMDSHQHSHVNLSIFFIILKIALKYNFKSLRLSRNLPTKEIKGVKNIYKNFINRKIIKFNIRNGFEDNRYQFFGSKEDYEKEKIINNNFTEYSTVEMMVHPFMENKEILDSCTNAILFEYNQKQIEKS